ncbi:MAG TPA: AI-2E family transporter [Gaiellaceae bacterium]|nr:AI-2E family transporter [Gaiellaceae bacterium]
MTQTARRAAIATLVVVGIVVVALALWKLRALIALLLLAFIIAAAMRPGVEALYRRHIPRGVGVLLHYLAFAGLIALLLWFVVPRLSSQVTAAINAVPHSQSQLNHEAKHSTGLRHEILVAIQKRLKRLPSGTSLIHPAISATKTAFEVLVGIFFTFASAAYWVFERDRAMRLVLSLVSRPKRRVVRETWNLIDARLGAFVRGELILVCFVGTLLSLAFWLIGEPYFLLIGIFAGIVELIPVIGPLAAGALAVGIGFTASLGVAIGAGVAVLAVRMLEDYVVSPRLLGRAVGLSPLFVLVSVTATGLLLGGFYVLLAIPIASLIATLTDVIVRGVDPGEEERPAVLFSASDAER